VQQHSDHVIDVNPRKRLIAVPDYRAEADTERQANDRQEAPRTTDAPEASDMRRSFDCAENYPNPDPDMADPGLVDALGGFSDDTLAEDQDLTIAVRRAGHVIAYADDAIAFTEAPDTLRTLARQRFRWSFGTLQCMWKHRAAFLDPRTGSLGLIAMPNTWIFQLLFPAISPVADLLFLWSLVSVWLVRQQHGATYAVTDLVQVLTFYAVFLMVDWLAAVVAFLIEPGEDRSLTWLIFLQRFAYRQVMYWVVVRAFMVAIRGRLVGWGKLERKATVRVPA
jgi:cellulose synthase/poly-beta-1,6-N-acetylglucosamine synthase-like glycosyltransferase